MLFINTHDPSFYNYYILTFHVFLLLLLFFFFNIFFLLLLLIFFCIAPHSETIETSDSASESEKTNVESESGAFEPESISETAGSFTGS